MFVVADNERVVFTAFHPTVSSQRKYYMLDLALKEIILEHEISFP